jgi:hypothetical protein
MLVIRNSQMKALERAFQTERMVSHMWRCFPTRCERLGQSRVREVARRGIEKGAYYGFTRLADLQQYTDLTLVLGDNFESKPEYAWTRDILLDHNPAARDFRATWLYDNVVQRLKEKERLALRG